MDILDLAEKNYLISFGIVLTIGILQGLIIGRGIRQRFPSLKNHAKATSVILLILFSASAIVNVIKFSDPEKTTFNSFNEPQNFDQVLSLIVNFLGLDAGFGSVIALFVSITLILLFRLADLPSVARYFMFALSVIVLLIAFISRFTDYIPTSFQVFMYAFYQFGITMGIFAVTRRKNNELESI